MTASQFLEVDPAWREAHPGATVGLIAFRGVTQSRDARPAERPGERRWKSDVRSRLGDADRETMRATPPLPAYAAYYKRWGQRYHVAMQLESVAQKGKSIPRVAALVEAMFIAELRNLLLTAGHDLDALELPVRLGVGAARRSPRPTGRSRPSNRATCSSPTRAAASSRRSSPDRPISPASDRRRPRRSSTAMRRPASIPRTVDAHLDEIERNVRLIAPDAEIVGREIGTS